MTRAGFVTGGTWCLDRNMTLPHWPGEDQAVAVIDMIPSGGGCGCNFGADLHRLDPAIPVETMGLIGTDAEGDFLLEVAGAEGIGAARMHRTDAARTQSTDAYQSLASGRRTHILNEGTAALLSPDHFDFTDVSARYFHLGLPGIHRVMDAPWGDDPNGWVTVFKAARSAGLETNIELVSVAPDVLRGLALPCLLHLTTLVVNDYEIGALSQTETVRDGVTDRTAVEQAAQRVLGLGAMDLVAVHFTQGAVLALRDGTVIFQPSVAVPPAALKGANGAGDAFAAGFFYARHSGWDPQRCLVMAHATAAACLRSPSTYETVDRWQDCLTLAENWGWRTA